METWRAMHKLLSKWLKKEFSRLFPLHPLPSQVCAVQFGKSDAICSFQKLTVDLKYLDLIELQKSCLGCMGNLAVWLHSFLSIYVDNARHVVPQNNAQNRYTMIDQHCPERVLEILKRCPYAHHHQSQIRIFLFCCCWFIDFILTTTSSLYHYLSLKYWPSHPRLQRNSLEREWGRSWLELSGTIWRRNRISDCVLKHFANVLLI